MIERIEVTVYPNQAEAIERLLGEFQLSYVKTIGESYNTRCFFYIVTVPNKVSSALMEELASIVDTNHRMNLIAHYKTESTISDYLTRFELFLEKNDDSNTDKNIYAHSNLDLTFGQAKNKIKVKKTMRAPVEDLISKTNSFLSQKKDLYVMTLIATGVALVGLVSNNVAVIIGAMLLSPLLKPISSIALNSTLGRMKELNQSIIFTAKMILSSILLATAITILLSMIMHVQITSEIQLRTDARPATIVIAVMLGIAGGVAMLTPIPEIIVGVAIAVALIPPAAVTGIGIGLGSVDIASRALLVLVSNIIGLVIGFLLTFLLKGVTSRKYYERQKARVVVRGNILILVGLAASLVLIEKFLVLKY